MSQPVNSRVLPVFLVLTLASALEAPAVVVTKIDLSPVANGRLQGRHPLYPSGDSVVLGGVEFNIPAVGLNAWFAANAAGGGPGVVTATVPIGIKGVTGVHTLINTLWGVSGEPARAGLQFAFDDGSTFLKPLIGNVDIRDHYSNVFTNSVNGTTTIPIFFTDVNGPAGPNRYRLDKQFIDLTPFQDRELVSMTLIDGGNENVQRTFLFGATVTSVPEPSAFLAVAIAFVGVVAMRGVFFPVQLSGAQPDA